MKPVELHPTAGQEAEEAADHYDRQQQGLGQRFRLDFEQALETIGQHPLLYGVEMGEFRACPLKRFPYTLFYLDLEDWVWVAAVAHQKRRPGYWVGRQPG